MSNKDNLIQYLDQNNGKLVSETWSQLEVRFGINSGKIPGDKARKIWSRYKTKQEEIERLVLKSRWEVQVKGGGTKWLESYTNQFNPEDVKKFRKELIEEMSKFSPSNNVFKFNPSKDDSSQFMLEISMPDLHIGREDAGITKVRFLSTLAKIMLRCNTEISKIVFVLGNDFFNTDNTDYRTTRGTQQFDYMDWKEGFIAAKNIAIEGIEFLKRKNVPIEVIIVPGNHDTSKMFYLGDVIDAYYRNDSQVLVNNGPQTFKYTEWGNSFIMYDHGEIKPNDYPLIMATEYPIQWSKSKFREVHTGHLHHEILKDYRGVKVRYFPSLAVQSQWEKDKGYGGFKEAQSIVWSKNHGIMSIIPVIME
jgi:hypothetical protein